MLKSVSIPSSCALRIAMEAAAAFVSHARRRCTLGNNIPKRSCLSGKYRSVA